jgi:hypothetical protein
MTIACIQNGIGPMEYLVEYLGTPFAWSIFVVFAIAVAAAMIVDDRLRHPCPSQKR